MLATKNNFIEGCGVFFFAIKKITEEKKVHRDNFLTASSEAIAVLGVANVIIDTSLL